MPFRLRITLSILLVVAIFLAGFSGFMLRRDLVDGLEQAQRNLDTQGELLDSAILSALLTFDFATADTAAAKLAGAPGVASVSVFSPDGDLIAHHGTPDETLPSGRRGLMQFVAGAAFDEGRIDRDVIGPTGVVGALSIEADLRELHANITADAIWTLQVALFGCAAVGATSWWLGAMLGRRIERLTSGAQKIADGELDYRLQVTGTDEVAKIGQAIDGLADSLIKDRSAAAKQARTDALTGLLNRTGLAEAIDRLSATGRPIAVLHIDLDRFKLINDTRGHVTGDTVLKTVGARLQSVASHAVALARTGGDEFVALLDVEAGSEIARKTGQHIIEAIKQPLLCGETTLRVGSSVGVAGLPPGPHARDQLETVLANADIALYQAKTAGRGQVAIFDAAARSAREAEADLEWEVSEALKTSAFVPYIQPQVDCQTGRIVGAEVLARWQHPTRGLLSPASFLEGLRNVELSDAIDEQVHDAALIWMAEQSEARPATISVNLTPAQMNRVGSAQTFSNRVAELGLRPDQVVVEVHENVILDDDGVVQENLDTLIKRGHALELDDFGTGSASLQHLIQMDLDTLKIDRSFVIDIDSDTDRQSIVGAIIGMAYALGVRVLAEGVETEAERDMLIALGCPVIQGFLFARPMSLAEYPDWADDWHRAFDAAA